MATASVAVLEPRPHGTASALGSRLRGWHPSAVFAAAIVVGYVVLAALAIALGLLLVHVILPFHGVGSADEHVNAWLARHRSPGLDEVTFVGSAIGDVPVLPAVVVLAVIVAASRRHWRIAGFVAGAILVEAATYRITSLIVHRQRPAVVRLDHLPANQSYPSGHVAAAVAVYAALALLVSSWAHDRRVTAAACGVALALVGIVAFSRLDRGMHHPIDAAAGVLVGSGALLVAVTATRAAAEADRRRADRGRR